MIIVLVIERTRSSPDSSPRFTFVYSIRQDVGRLSGEIGMKRLVPFLCPFLSFLLGYRSRRARLIRKGALGLEERCIILSS